MRRARRPWYRRPCLNCAEPGRCLCWSCCRVYLAGVLSVALPAVILELVKWALR